MSKATSTASFNRRFGSLVRASRSMHGWTQKEVAEMAGVHPNFLARVERGEVGTSLFVASKIAKAVATDLATLTSGEVAG